MDKEILQATSGSISQANWEKFVTINPPDVIQFRDTKED